MSHLYDGKCCIFIAQLVKEEVKDMKVVFLLALLDSTLLLLIAVLSYIFRK